ncbi:MAG: phosphoribosylaminoimidazolesuccinocarboxamide synthase [Desulfuromonadaceae bacterium]|nr:phosphoribosylaminoimidazolesuccinocarboxamide synthase [Desulfuromonadaceae bacterium]
MYAYDMQHHPTSYSVDPLLFTSFPGMTLMRRGKDKDVYDLGDMLLMVSTDRLSAAGKSLNQGVKGKGKIVNQISAYWFRKLRNVFPNHLVSINTECFPESIRNHAEILDGCSMLVWKTTPLPIRCVVRGYLAGAGWLEYLAKGEICGTKLPSGLVESQRLPSPIFAPTVKGRPGGNNENIDFMSLQELLGKSLAEQLRETSLRLYFIAWKSARERGVLIADTKFEFGLHDGKLMLIDECLTPDTSRFWGIDGYRYGGSMPVMGKQILVDYLDALDNPNNIEYLPEEMLFRIGGKYNEAYKRIVGKRAYSKMGVPCR